jgi:hypothetical protein
MMGGSEGRTLCKFVKSIGLWVNCKTIQQQEDYFRLQTGLKTL